MKELGLYFLIGLALLAIGIAIGIGRESHRGALAIVGVQGELATCKDANNSQATALNTLKQQNEAHLAELRDRAADAPVALADRDTKARADTAAALRRYTHTAQVPHEKVDCQALAVLPVCPAVAERLWGRDATRETTDATDVSAGDTHAGY